ncbi:DEAD-domain-containing protein [Leucogyrophana mollusca]|uniref:DEAD-domain-containing protein n=1 Tax=Leucogyrophana mollusca TaxID=85980 RepID=A0ACB8BMD6_9AGAM|nr:DEAD-domain-containing protein [Leucogyrophana mollusca]
MHAVRRSLHISLTRCTRSGLDMKRGPSRNIRSSAPAKAPAVATAAKVKLPPPTPLAAPAAAPAMAPSSMPTDRSHFSALRFQDAPISQASKASIQHEFMTDVQEATLQLGLSGVDLLVQAKTGTGKTAAFLLPAIENLAKQKLPSPNQISILVLSPTRELALQIEKEAKGLLQHHQLAVQSVIGGTNINTETNRIANQRCDILVATPGRLVDHLQSNDLKTRLGNLKTLVLDEADRLLDSGFKPELEKILTFLPNRQQVPRQCMLYSATLSKPIRQIASLYLHPNHKFVSTLHEDEINTHQHVSQSFVIASMEDTLPAALSILRAEMAENLGSFKCMVFCTTARGTSAAAEILAGAGGSTLPPILEIHSRMSQNARGKSAEAFKNAKSAILFSSDVTARGMDFPGVNLVLQMGLPSSAEQYIHRLGRTARAGAGGRGIILLSNAESFFLGTREMSSLPVTRHAPLPPLDRERESVAAAIAALDEQTQQQAYAAWLGFNKMYLRQLKWTPAQLVDEGNKYAREVLGWRETKPPPLMKKAAGMMGLTRVPGLNLVGRLPWDEERPPRGQPKQKR